MRLTEHENDRLLIFLAAELARRRRSNGLALNHPEAVAIIADEMMEAARAGATYDEVEQLGYELLTEDDVLPGVADMVDNIQVEPLFDDGTHIVILYHPIVNRASGQTRSDYPGDSSGKWGEKSDSYQVFPYYSQLALDRTTIWQMHKMKPVAAQWN